MPSRRPSRRSAERPATTHAPVWGPDEVGLPPLDGVVPALASFDRIGDASPLDIELRASEFLGHLGAGALADPQPGEPDHEELLNGLVEVCLHHLDAEPPRVVVDFCWVVDAFDPGYVQWPLHDRLLAADLPGSPAWLMAVGDASITGAWTVGHETGDGYDVVVTARHPGAESDHVLAVYVDRTLGDLAKDLLVHSDAAKFLELAEEDTAMVVTEISPSTAAATIDVALDATFEAGAIVPVSDTFASLFSIVEHYVAKLPTDGRPLARPPVSTPEEQSSMIDAFLGSDAGAVHASDRDALAAAVAFVVDEVGGEADRWSPVVTHLVMAGWLPRAELEEPSLVRFGDLLRDFVPWVHRLRGWDDRYVADTLAIIDAVEGEVDEAQSGGRVEILEQAVVAGVDLDDEAALDAFLDEYLEDS
ncbi:MAG: hypothetical protein OSA99_04360 [Acidimicrobiales bacterium]|nr:hypothetical protein [Acidimicrobiales bacterium]